MVIGSLRFDTEWMGEKAMFAVAPSRVDRSIGRLLQGVAGSLFVSLRFIGNGLGLHKILRWLQDEKIRIATIRELHRLNDDYLDDIGIKRKDIHPIVNTMMRRKRNRRRNLSSALTSIPRAPMALNATIGGDLSR